MDRPDLKRMLLAAAAHLPLARSARNAYLERQFRHWPGAFRGVYATFAEARAAAPTRARVGYDYDEFGSIYDDRLFRVFPADYPVMFWLERALRDSRRVFDFGGHVGLAFYGFERYVAYPSDLVWTLYDVPKVIDAARALAARHPRPQLRFSAQLSDLAHHDVLHAAGALQYVEQPLAATLVELGARPKHLLLNKLPLSDTASFATLQNTMHAYNPYAVFNRARFVSDLEALGYELVDAWTTPELGCSILDHPERSVAAYSGMYLRRRAT